MGFYKDIGLLLLGTRLRRISDKFFSEVASIYKSQNQKFEVAWFPFIYLLHKKGSLTLTEIACELEISHSAASQMVTTLSKQDLIKFSSSEDDLRKKQVDLSPKAKEEIVKLSPLWEAINKSVNSFLLLQNDKQNFLCCLDEIEENLEKKLISKKARLFIENEKYHLEVEALDSKSKWDKLTAFIEHNEIDYLLNDKYSIKYILSDLEIKGFIAYLPTANNIYIDYVYVLPDMRRHCLASYMINHLTQIHDMSSRSFMIKARNHQLTSVLMKSGFPFMVK